MVREGARVCSQCGAEGAGPRCIACLESEYPSIVLQRGGKWRPLGVALFSVICDPLMIPTILAIWRAVGELREVARRERAGLHREEHAKVRTEAVWGILIAAARPLLVALVLLTVGESRPMHPVLPADELAEILERLGSDDEETHGLALDHLYELTHVLPLADLDRVLDAVEVGFGHDDEDEAWMRSSVATAIAGSPRIVARSGRIARLYPTLEHRGALLPRVVVEGSPDAIRLFVRLAEGDHDPNGPQLPAVALADQLGHAELFVGPLVRLPGDASLRAGVPWLLANLCGQGLDGRVLAPVRGRLISDWAEARDALPPPASSLEERTSRARVARVARARHQLDALRCVAGPDVDALLAEATAHADTLVAVAAVRALLERGAPVPGATLTRLAADPLARADLVDALRRHGRELELPRALRTERALAEAQLLRALWLPGEISVVDYTWLARVEPRVGASVHVFALAAREDDGPFDQHVAIGPYPEVLTAEVPRLRWRHADEALDPAALAAALLSERDYGQALDEELDAIDDLDGDQQ